ncbi:MAG TPA: glycoside hydrolase family 2 TIM barrel-domain containing protein [Ktedonobacteraceae bacterium]|nr:glycoside hydrolase family 2 TIM barrel-domain containing protein [Ktedonobacteraceae bacterium]
MQENTSTLHPRPQLTRARWIDLGGEWGFTYDDEACGINEHWQEKPEEFTRTIKVPYPPESKASGIGDNGFHAIVWYRRTFEVDDQDAGKRLLLHCGAVDYSAHVWVNGHLVATHEGGQTPFSADITSALHPSREQVVVIRAEDEPKDLTQPRGKQDWQEPPHEIWYHRTTGIWQPVWLEPISSTYISQIRWTPDLDRGLLSFAITLEREEDAPLNLRVKFNLHGVDLADDTYMMRGTELKRQIAFDPAAMVDGGDRLMWSPRNPNLIDVTLTLLEGKKIIDEVQSYIGIRSVSATNGRFLLNGLPYYLRLVLEQGYWPETHLAAPDDDALRREVELIKEMGFNGVRIHQKVEDPRFLYWCDRLGLLVWGEMANAYVFSPQAVGRLTREWIEAVNRDYNHPCIVAWVPFNESWGVPNVAHDEAQQHYVQALYHLSKTLDPTRPTVGNDGWDNFVSDIFGVHDYSFDGSVLRDRYGSFEAVERTLREVQPNYHSLILPGYRREGEPIMLTEFGGISFHPDGGGPGYGYSTVNDDESFLARYGELLDAILNSPAIAGFCYTQLTDVEQETNGLLTENREPKLNPADVRAITSQVSAAVPGDVITKMLQAHSVTSFTSAALKSKPGS